MSAARLTRFMDGTNGNKHLAFRRYVWNARLCEEFYLPLQMAEISVRNAIHQTLTRRFGADWPTEPGFVALLPQRYKAELEKVVADERSARRAAYTVDHVVSGSPQGLLHGRR